MNENDDNLKKNLMKSQNERDKLLNEIEKFKNHIILLTESNKELMDELESVLNGDDRVRNILDRENQILISSNFENRNNVSGNMSPIASSSKNVSLSPM